MDTLRTTQYTGMAVMTICDPHGSEHRSRCESKTNKKKADENGKVLKKEISSDFNKFYFMEKEKLLSILKY